MSRKDIVRRYDASEKGKAAKSRWRRKNTDYQNTWRKKNPNSVQISKWKHRYGFVPPPAPEHCEGCNRHFSETSKHHGPCVDHDHIREEFRGWLCNDCNLILGYAKDSRDRLQLLINYLDRYELTR